MEKKNISPAEFAVLMAKEVTRLENLIITQVLENYLGRRPWDVDFEEMELKHIAPLPGKRKTEIYFRGKFLGTRITTLPDISKGREVSVKFNPDPKYKPLQ